MKKFILNFLLILAAVCVAVATSGCLGGQRLSMGEWSTVEGQEPTGTKGELESSTDSDCGDSKELPAEKLEHDHDWGDYVHNEDSTPDDLGDDTHTRTCKYEGCYERETEFCAFIVNITGCCTTRTCVYCGYFYKELKDLYGHSYTGEWEYSGDWFSGWDGTPIRAHQRECDYGCGWVIAERCEYESVTVPAYGENGGYTIYTCKVCGHSYTE